MTRFRLHRAGILNVWQYDDQTFELGEGRMLLRGTNGAGKSKTLELLLPYCLDGDNARMNASGTANSLLWLMFDGYDDTLRVGYVWVELVRRDEDGTAEYLTCGIGLRGSQSAKHVKKWMFTTSRRVGVDLDLEGPDGPLGESALGERLGADGQVFQTVRDYRAHVGRRLFGLDPARYDDLLRLLYWLRRPQVGEEIEPQKLADQLAQSLPEIDPEEIEKAGNTLDALAEHGERLERTRAARDAVATALGTYRRYARQAVRARSAALVEAADRDRTLAREVRRSGTRVAELDADLERTRTDRRAHGDRAEAARARLAALGTTPDEKRLDDLRTSAEDGKRSVERQREALARAAAALARAESAEASLLRSALDAAADRDGEAGRIATAVAEHSLVLPAGFAGDGAAAAAFGAQEPEQAVTVWLDAHGAAVVTLATEVTARRAVVEQVRGLAREHADAQRQADQASATAEDAAARADDQRARHRAAVVDGERTARNWQDAVRGWAGRPEALELPAVAALLAVPASELGDAEPGALADEAAAQAVPELDRRKAVEAGARLALEQSSRDLAQTRAVLETVRAERDPAPPAAQLLRRRDQTALPGMPFWRAVDFRAGVGTGERAAIEAALQQSGLLDAWLDPDGTVRGAHEVVLVAGAAAAGDSLADVLVAEESAPYAAAVLAAIALRPGSDTGEEPVSVGTDGSFRVGPLAGRAAKPAAQYVGAAARQAERARRVAELEARIAVLEREVADAGARTAEAGAAIAALEAWLRSVPPTRDLERARARVGAAYDELRRLEAQAAELEQAAVALRQRAALAARALTDAAGEHALPTDADELERRAGVLRVLGKDVTEHRNRLERLLIRAKELAQAGRDAAASLAARDETQRALEAATTEATTRQATYETVAAALSDTLAELEARRAGARQELATAIEAEKRLGEQAEQLSTELGSARQRAAAAQAEHGQHQAVLSARCEGVAALRDVQGLLATAAGALDDDTVRALAAGAPDGLLRLARDWAGWEGQEFDDNALLRAAEDLKSGPAASYEPALVRVHDTYALLAEHEGRTVPLAELDEVLTRKVDEDEALLTEHERRAFEEVLLGALGDQLRSRLQESQDLVTGMNGLLEGVRTSQGIRVRLRWRLRDDIPPEAREVATLVVRTGAALTPDERDRLTAAMSRLVDLAADDAPEDGYQVHLQRALDYRTWHGFRVQYARPGTDWQDLNRRSPLSQGEQKVACYLPLFAAAAAHFTSVAGAAPYAPRFVLLDDAFPKIDARTHPVLFGLLVDLDLDFVVTSERLWGDHPQVPRLEIYEALRSPGEPGIAHAHYSWDGRTLQSVTS